MSSDDLVHSPEAWCWQQATEAIDVERLQRTMREAQQRFNEETERWEALQAHGTEYWAAKAVSHNACARKYHEDHLATRPRQQRLRELCSFILSLGFKHDWLQRAALRWQEEIGEQIAAMNHHYEPDAAAATGEEVRAWAFDAQLADLNHAAKHLEQTTKNLGKAHDAFAELARRLGPRPG